MICLIKSKNRIIVGAVVVTYNPDLGRFRRMISALEEEEVKRIVVVDNGSKNINKIEKIVGKNRIIKLENNQGIAKGMNIGIRDIRSVYNDLDWILTLDQDTILKNGSIMELFREYDRLPEKFRSKVGILAMSPKEKDNDKYTYGLEESSKFVKKLFAQTSGNLIKAQIFDKIRFRDDFFIDHVDHEFDINLRKRGFLIIEYDRKTLDHSLGKEIKSGAKKINYYNEKRLYYYTRNSTYLITRYESFPIIMYVLGILSMYSRFLRVKKIAGVKMGLFVFFSIF